MSMVITSTAAPAPTETQGQHLVLRLRSSRVIQDLEHSPLFTEEETNTLKECLAAITEKNIPYVLSLMLFKVVKPAKLKAEGVNQHQLLDFMNEINKLLAFFLPPGTNVDEFVTIEEAIHREAAAKVVLPLCKKIHDLYHARYELILNKGKRFDQKIDEEFNAIKAEIFRLRDLHQDVVAQLHRELQPLVQRILAAQKELKAEGLALRDIGKISDQQSQQLQHILGDVHELCFNI